MSDKFLSIRHGRFVRKYLKDGNATRARQAQRAGKIVLRPATIENKSSG